MKKTVSVILIAALLFCFCACNNDKVSGGSLLATMGEPLPEITLSIPDDPTEFSEEFAHELLDIAAATYDPSIVEKLYANPAQGIAKDSIVSAYFDEMNFEALVKGNYDKTMEDRANSCGYIICRGVRSFGETRRDVYLVACRGTVTLGEWGSNFNFAPNDKGNAIYAENFKACATDVFNTLTDITDTAEPRGTGDPIVIITGHSRGASSANLLGLLCNQWYGEENVYCYTFASPATINRNKLSKIPHYDAANIINIINPADIVPELPTSQWGFMRAGVDIMLPDGGGASTVQGIMSAFGLLAPNTDAYYRNVFPLLETLLSSVGDIQMGGEKPAEIEIPGILKMPLESAMAVLMQHMPDAYHEGINSL